MTETVSHYSASKGKLLVTLLLAVLHLLAGFSILMVSSWFIAACSVAGLGFNYMLPAVVIRALAILRIGSGYFSMLVGHSHLLGKLAAVRLNIFASLNNKVMVSREESLDVLHHQSEEVAAIWMSWVGQNAGAFLSLLVLNFLTLVLIPELSQIVLFFSFLFAVVYAALLGSMVYKSADLVAVRKQLQFDLVKHIESAPLWHLYSDYQKQAPRRGVLQRVVNELQQRIRGASILLFAGSIIAVSSIFSFYSPALGGNALFIIVPVALLSINDWLAPTLGNQKQLLAYVEAKHAMSDSSILVEGVNALEGNIQQIDVTGFKASATRMPSIDASFQQNSTSVLIGGSGVGKSRFLQALSGLLPFEGRREVALEQGVVTSQALLTDSFYLEQFPYVLSDTLAENLRVANRDASDCQLVATLKQVGLGEVGDLNQWLGEHGRPLSGGEKKRLGLARAILSSANVLLLDEPFESLDEQNVEKVTEIINGLASHKIIVLATHILPQSLKYQQCLALNPVSVRKSINADLEGASS
jgi:ATP-binding cassette subfamily C protein CydC